MVKIILRRNQYETLMAEAADKLRETQDDLDRLRALNAELVTALERIAERMDNGLLQRLDKLWKGKS